MIRPQVTTKPTEPRLLRSGNLLPNMHESDVFPEKMTQTNHSYATDPKKSIQSAMLSFRVSGRRMVVPSNF